MQQGLMISKDGTIVMFFMRARMQLHEGIHT